MFDSGRSISAFTLVHILFSQNNKNWLRLVYVAKLNIHFECDIFVRLWWIKIGLYWGRRQVGERCSACSTCFASSIWSWTFRWLPYKWDADRCREQRRSLPEQMRANKSLACVHNYSNVVVDPMMTLQKVIHEQGHSADTYCSFMLVLELFNKIAGNF